jgi:hypothetical protein
VLRGGLRGGTALCSNLDGFDLFSRFDQIYPSISQYLGTSTGSSGAIPFTNVTSLWWVPNESGWGLNLVHRNGSNIVFGHLVHLRRGWQAHLVRDALRQLVLEQHV